jgi:hypothetical protein
MTRSKRDRFRLRQGQCYIADARRRTLVEQDLLRKGFGWRRLLALQNSRILQHNGLSHFDARHPLPIVKDVLSALPDLVAIAAIERLCRQRRVRL